MNLSDFGAVFKAAAKSLYVGSLRHLMSEEDFLFRSYKQLSAAWESPDPYCIGVEEEGRLIAVLLGYGDQASGSYVVPLLWVDPKNRNLHLGTRLGQLVVAHAQACGYRRLVCETSSNNPPIKRLLKGLNFHQSRVIWNKAL